MENILDDELSNEPTEEPSVDDIEEGAAEHSTPSIVVLDKERQNVLFEILRCAVCLEIPKTKQVQIKSCEKGHHFCTPCHKKLRSCAICRGRLFLGRNFVVEEIITKLGKDLGFVKSYHVLPKEAIPTVEPPRVGLIPCLVCKKDFREGHMLPHVRQKHTEFFIEKKQTNPYTGKFDWSFQLSLTKDLTYFHLLYITGLGLFTLIINYDTNDIIGWIQMAANQEVSDNYRYFICFKFKNGDTIQSFGLDNATVCSNLIRFNDMLNNGGVLNAVMDNQTDTVSLVVDISIWNKEKQIHFTEPPPAKFMSKTNEELYECTKKLRKTRARNMRKKQARHLKKVKKMGETFSKLSTDDKTNEIVV